MNIYVGNLPYKTENDSLREVFEQYGDVDTVDIIVDRRSGRSRGYGFVTMPDDAQGQQAVDALNGYELDGRNIRVDVSKPNQDGEKGGRRPRSNNDGNQRNASNNQHSHKQSPGNDQQKTGGIMGFIKKLFS